MKKHKDVLRYSNFGYKEEKIFILSQTIDNMSKIISVLKDEIIKLSNDERRAI
jgi:hypothetical protein